MQKNGITRRKEKGEEEKKKENIVPPGANGHLVIVTVDHATL